MNISVPLVMEYRDICLRMLDDLGLTELDIDTVIDSICGVSNRWKTHYLWRPHLQDSGDDKVLEVAVASGSEAIITFNTADFAGIEQFGLTAYGPKELLRKIGVLP